MSESGAPGPGSDTSRNLNRTARALAELRRGLPIVLYGSGEAPALMLAAETATEDGLTALVAWNPQLAQVAITASRARALNILPSGHDVILIDWRHWFDLDSIRGVGDATTDLAAPLRGPFERAKRAPSGPETAAIQLTKLARLLPVAVVVPLPADEAGAWSDPPAWAAAHDLLSLDAASVASHEAGLAQTLRQVTSAQLALAGAEETQLVAFRPADGSIEHLALIIGNPNRREPVLARLHSECFTGDLLGSLKCDCGQQLRGAIEVMGQSGGGILLYLAQEGRGIGLMNKLRAYRLQDEGFDTIDANLRLGFEADERIFRPAAEMLRQLGIKRVRLLTNNPDKLVGLAEAGIEVAESVRHSFPSNRHNEFYLATKRRRSGHLS